MRRILAVSILAVSLTGCGPLAVVSAGADAGVSAAENRSVGRKLDDTVIYTDITNQFAQADESRLLRYVSFNIRYGRVMLTGNVQNQDDAMKAAELAWKAKGVTEVINELIVNPDAGFMDTANDSFIKRNLESRLLITKGVWVINYSIDVQGGTAYLIGRVADQTELDKVLNIARTTRGVKRVVSHLQINTDTMSPVGNPNDAPANSGPSSSSSSPSSSNTGSYGGATMTNTKSSISGNTGGGSDVYTGPVYSGGSITSSDH
jgi:osmotically-inducible protein OsmY